MKSSLQLWHLGIIHSILTKKRKIEQQILNKGTTSHILPITQNNGPCKTRIQSSYFYVRNTLYSR